MTSVKKMPIEIAVPEFWKVARIPDATPRSDAGTLPMIEEEFGEANIPVAAPIRASSSANTGYGKSTGSNISPMNAEPRERPRRRWRSLASRSGQTASQTPGPRSGSPTVSGSM